MSSDIAVTGTLTTTIAATGKVEAARSTADEAPTGFYLFVGILATGLAIVALVTSALMLKNRHMFKPRQAESLETHQEAHAEPELTGNSHLHLTVTEVLSSEMEPPADTELHLSVLGAGCSHYVPTASGVTFQTGPLASECGALQESKPEAAGVSNRPTDASLQCDQLLMLIHPELESSATANQLYLTMTEAGSEYPVSLTSGVGFQLGSC